MCFRPSGPINYWPNRYLTLFTWGLPRPGPCFPERSNRPWESGLLLYQGIGDTLRVSLTAHPREEIKVAYRDPAGLGFAETGD